MQDAHSENETVTRDHRVEFDAFYDEQLEPILLEFEEERKKVKRKVLITAFITFGLAMGALPLFINELVIPAIILLVVCLGGGFWLMKHLTKDYVQAFKSEVVGGIASYVDESITYNPDGCISEGEYGSSRIFKRQPDRYNGEDLFVGCHDKTDFKFSEIHSEYKTETTDSKGNRSTQWHTIFKGVFFIADFHKDFQGLTVVLPEGASGMFGKLGEMLQETFKHSGELVKLDDPEFEKAFIVYGSDQIEARYILSHSMMSRIMAFKQKHKARIHMSFHHSNLYLALSSGRDRFEPRIMKTVLDRDLCLEYLDDLMFAIEMIDDLNLNTRIWTKQ